MRQPDSNGRRAATLSILGAALAAVGGLSGCIVAPVHPRYHGRGYNDGGGGDVVYAPPPAPRYEVIGVAPYPGWFWIGGYWTWRAGRHAWVDGRWSAPRHGYRWQPHRWEPIARGSSRGWREAPGRWN
jgi:hypothetical protein